MSISTQTAFIKSAPFKVFALANRGRNVTVEYIGRKVSQIDLDEAKQFGINALRLAVSNLVIVNLASSVSCAWNFAVQNVAVIVGDTLSTTVTLATVALSGAAIVHKLSKQERPQLGPQECRKKAF